MGGALIYSIYIHREAVSTSNELNSILSKQIEESILNQKKQITSDSLKYVIAIDSLAKEIKLIDKKRKNERSKLQSTIAKISSITDNSDFDTINDSIEKCCTVR